MSDLDHYLLSCIASSDPAISNAATLAQQYTQQLQAGEISKEEYAEIINDIHRSSVIANNMSEMEAKEMLHTALHGLIAVASAL